MSADGKTVMAANYSGVEFWKSDTGKKSRSELQSSQARTMNLYASTVNSLFATEGDDGVKVWSTERESAIHQFQDWGSMFLPNGMLASATDNDITLWQYVIEGHMGTYQAVKRAILHSGPESQILATSADGKFLITGSTETGTLNVWLTDEPMLLQANDKIKERTNDVVLSADGNAIVALSGPPILDRETVSHQVLLRWKASNLSHTTRIPIPGGLLIGEISVSSDGNRALLWEQKKDDDDSEQQRLMVLDLPSDKIVFPKTGKFLTDDAVISADGNYLLSIDGDEIVRWDLNDGKSTKRCSVEGSPLAVLFGSNSGEAYVAGDDLNIRFVNLSTCDAKGVLSFSEQKSDSVELGWVTGGIAASVSRSTKNGDSASHMKIWSKSANRQIFKSDKYDFDEFALAIAHGRTILVNLDDDDKNAHLTDPAKEQEILQFPVDWEDCCGNSGLALFPDFSKMVTLWDDRGGSRVRLWRLFPSNDALKAYARKSVSECLSPDKRKTLGLEPEPPAWCVTLKKRPYATKDWASWLADKGSHLSPPLPNTPEWKQWLTAHRRHANN